MGLLDSLFSGGAGSQGLLAGSAALLNAGGPSRLPISFGQGISQALGAGQKAYQDAQEFALQKQYREAQMAKLKADAEAKARQDEFLQKAMSGGALDQTNPDQLEQVAFGLSASGHPLGPALMAKANRMRETALQTDQWNSMKAKDEVPAVPAETVAPTPESGPLQIEGKPGTPGKAGMFEVFMGPEMAQIPGVQQRAMAVANQVQQNPTGDPKWARNEFDKLSKAVEDFNAKAIATNDRKQMMLDQQNFQRSQQQQRLDAPPKLSLKTSVASLTEEQNNALFGPNGAVTQGRLDPNRINSRTAPILADAALLNPNTDFAKISGDIQLSRNATFRQKAIALDALPEMMKNMVDAGKKIGFSDVRTIGKMQAWFKGELNDPDMTEYMVQRNDALMAIAFAMRGVGMSDQAHRAEIEVSAPSMSPEALDAWMRGQMKSLEPRLKRNQEIIKNYLIRKRNTLICGTNRVYCNSKTYLTEWNFFCTNN